MEKCAALSAPHKAMRIICVPDEYEMGLAAARIMAALVRLKPDAILGLASGSTPLGAYAELIRMHREEDLDFSRITTFNPDEYIGLDKYHPQSYRVYMRDNFIDGVNIDPDNVHLPNGIAPDIGEECRAYDELLEARGFPDLQLLGIGTNGHIAFNEPAASFTAETHMVALTEDTIDSNQRFFDRREEMPTQAITVGMRGIMNSSRILLIASGKGKARAIAQTCFGPVTPQVPGSILQLHRDVIVIADREALSETDITC